MDMDNSNSIPTPESQRDLNVNNGDLERSEDAILEDLFSDDDEWNISKTAELQFNLESLVKLDCETADDEPSLKSSLKHSKFAQVLGLSAERGNLDRNPNHQSPISSSSGNNRRPNNDFSINSDVMDQHATFDTSTSLHTSGSIHEDDLNDPPFSLQSNPFGIRAADSQWRMNYQEAAIYLEEGENNDAFSTHPKRKESLPAYILAHTSWFYLIDITASLLILFLAICEPPAAYYVPIAIHTSLELGALAVIAFGLILKLRWLGFKAIFKHHRTLIKATTLFIMITESVVVLIRQSSHFRVTRALRPIFFVDNRYLRGVRRFVRQVLQSLPPILDMLVLLFFFIFIFTLLAHFLFGSNKEDPYFTTIESSFVNLFILLTTANYPDVMMPAYYKNRFSVLFFVAYLVTVLYLFMNLLLAVVYDTFTTLEKEKFRKLVIHKRKSCHFAFNLLVSKANKNGIIFRHFYGMMTYYKPDRSLRDIYLTFRAVNSKSGNNGVLTRDEFCRFFEFSDLKWRPLKPSNDFQRNWTYFKEYGVLVQRFLNSPYADYIFNSAIFLNTISMFIRWLQGSNLQGTWDSYIFAIWFIIEMSMKFAGWGHQKIFSSGWHTFDLLASLTFFFSLLIVEFIPRWNELLTFLRPLRLLRLFKIKKRYRDVFGTLFILIPPMSSAAIVILLLYYFFSIIGMEIFSNVELKDCCNNTLYESYFTDGPNGSLSLRFYLNSFQNILASSVTLFELTVVNNWYVIMEGHVLVTSKFSRVYFIVFYLVTMVLLTIIVAFILDTFLFRIQYKREMDKKTEEKMLRTEVKLSAEEIDFCYRQYTMDPKRKEEILQDLGEDLASKGYVSYIGVRRRTKEILFKRMFKNEIPTWLRESEPILQINH